MRGAPLASETGTDRASPPAKDLEVILCVEIESDIRHMPLQGRREGGWRKFAKIELTILSLQFDSQARSEFVARVERERIRAFEIVLADLLQAGNIPFRVRGRFNAQPPAKIDSASSRCWSR